MDLVFRGDISFSARRLAITIVSVGRLPLFKTTRIAILRHEKLCVSSSNLLFIVTWVKVCKFSRLQLKKKDAPSRIKKIFQVCCLDFIFGRNDNTHHQLLVLFAYFPPLPPPPRLPTLRGTNREEKSRFREASSDCSPASQRPIERKEQTKTKQHLEVLLKREPKSRIE